MSDFMAARMHLQILRNQHVDMSAIDAGFWQHFERRGPERPDAQALCEEEPEQHLLSAARSIRSNHAGRADHDYDQKRAPSAGCKTESPVSAEPILRPFDNLGRRLGNASMRALLQAKLKVSNPNDIYEQEADRVADQAMRTPAPRSCSGAARNAKTKCIEQRMHRQASPPSTCYQTSQFKGVLAAALRCPTRCVHSWIALRRGLQPRTYSHGLSRARIGACRGRASFYSRAQCRVRCRPL